MIYPGFLISCVLFALASPAPEAPKPVDLTVHAEYLHVAPGEVVRNALIQIQEGKIASVLPGAQRSRWRPKRPPRSWRE